MNFLFDYILLHINTYIKTEIIDEITKFIDVVDVNKLGSLLKRDLTNPRGQVFITRYIYEATISDSINLTTEDKKLIADGKVYSNLCTFFLLKKTVMQMNFSLKFFLVLNVFLINLIFFENLSGVTFWTFPALFLFFSAIILLFLIKPNGLNMWIWVISKFVILFVIFYQLCNILLYLNFFENGIGLKVGKSMSFDLPFNINLAKLVSTFLVLFSIFVTLLFYMECYYKTFLLIKPEFCIVLFFLGFGCHMVFLQNDLFSFFLYFEIISFCIYGLLFLHKWTNAQLHALVRYVLFSLWVSTCYIVGVAFYLVSNWTSTSLYYFKENYLYNQFKDELLSNFLWKGAHVDLFISETLSNDNFIQTLIQEFELLLSIIFILLYFLFKLGAGPFYSWTIEVYNSSSTGSLFIISMIPKLIYFPIMFFILFYNFIEYSIFWSSILFVMGSITVFIGSFGILITNKLKEIYAWSSIIHTGNLLLISSAISSNTLTFIMFYLTSYFLISFGFLVLIISLRNKITGRFIKTISELTYINELNSNFYILVILLLASASGFTPFLSFFMKFSLLSILSSYYGAIITIIIGLLNIIGSVAYLRMLRNIIGFNWDNFSTKSYNITKPLIEMKLPYNIGWLFNSTILLIILSFIFYKDFISLFSFFENPIFTMYTYCLCELNFATL